jgi:uncharacterized protein YcnI
MKHPMIPHILKTAALVASLAAGSLAQAHVTLEEPAAIAGTGYKAVLRVGHGCEGTATHTVTVRIPAGFQGAKPMPKPGWVLDIQRAPLPTPLESHGRKIDHDVVQISWKAATREAALPDAQYDEFVLRGQLPARPGPLWFKVQQLCDTGQWDWFDTPADGKSTSRAGLKAPAALLEVLPGMGSNEHRH